MADKFLHGVIVPANAYYGTNFQLLSSISFGDMEVVPVSHNKKWELLIFPDAPWRTHFYKEPCHLHMPTSVPNFNFLAPLVMEIWMGPKIKKVGAADLPDALQRINFKHVAIVPANAYQCTKFQLHSSITFRDMEGVLK